MLLKAKAGYVPSTFGQTISYHTDCGIASIKSSDVYISQVHFSPAVVDSFSRAERLRNNGEIEHGKVDEKSGYLLV